MSSLASDLLNASETIERICAQSGSPASIFGGTNDTLDIGIDFALSARSTNVASSLLGIDVETTCLPASAIGPKFLTTVCGSSWCSMAFITHFCRAILE